MIGPGSFQALDGKGEVKMIADGLEPFRSIGRLTVNGDLVTEVRPFLQDLGGKQAPSGPFPTGLQVLECGHRIGSNSFSLFINRDRDGGGIETIEQLIDLANQSLRPLE